jgi:hypothetical protein
MVWTNSRDIKLPIKYEKDRKSIRQAILWYARNGENTWYIASAVAPTADSFIFRAPEDGLYWFTMQTEDLQGRRDPPDLTKTAPDIKMIVDSVPPQVQFTNVNRLREEVVIEWEIQDKYPNDAKSEVHFRVVGPEQRWTSVRLPAGSKNGVKFVSGTLGPVTVRVTGYDMAGNKIEAIREIPAAANTSTSLSPASPPPGTVASTPPAPASSSGVPLSPTAPVPPTSPPMVPSAPPATVPPAGPATIPPPESLAPVAPVGPSGGPVAPVAPPAAASVSQAPVVPTPVPPATKPAVPAAPPATPPAPAMPVAEAPAGPSMVVPSAGTSPAGTSLYPAPVVPATNVPPVVPPASTVPPFPPPGSTASASPPAAGHPLATVDPRQPPTPSFPAPGPIAGSTGPTPVPVWTGPQPAAPTVEVIRTNVINYLTFDVGYEVESRGPSGISSLDLWVTRDDGKTWVRWSQHDGKASTVRVNLNSPANPQPEGPYGFRVVPVSGVGLHEREPAPGDSPDLRVIIDVTPPQFDLYMPEGDPSNPDTLIIKWKATDKNFGEDPITLEWSDKPNGQWQPVAFGGDLVQASSTTTPTVKRLPNTGQYAWRVPSGLPPRVYLKATARDAAGNVREVVTKDPIAIDLVKPRAKISGIVTPTAIAPPRP